MKPIKIVVLGASGMLGSMVTDFLSRDSLFDVKATVRNSEYVQRGRIAVPEAEWTVVNSRNINETDSSKLFEGTQYVINAIGLIKPYIQDDSPQDVKRALETNVLFPFWLTCTAEEYGFQVVQIATDCVYSGLKGGYNELEPHDALDVYGKSKSLGEVRSKHVSHLRCSVIGPESTHRISLLEWFLGQSRNSEIQGFSNHCWNGITTLHFAKICKGIFTNQLKLPTLQHILSAGVVTKEDMLRFFARTYGRDDVTITSTCTSVPVDRTLATINPPLHRAIWELAGYDNSPTVATMIEELSAFKPRFMNVL